MWFISLSRKKPSALGIWRMKWSMWMTCGTLKRISRNEACTCLQVHWYTRYQFSAGSLKCRNGSADSNFGHHQNSWWDGYGSNVGTPKTRWLSTKNCPRSEVPRALSSDPMVSSRFLVLCKALGIDCQHPMPWTTSSYDPNRNLPLMSHFLKQTSWSLHQWRCFPFGFTVSDKQISFC